MASGSRNGMSPAFCGVWWQCHRHNKFVQAILASGIGIFEAVMTWPRLPVTYIIGTGFYIPYSYIAQ